MTFRAFSRPTSAVAVVALTVLLPAVSVPVLAQDAPGGGADARGSQADPRGWIGISFTFDRSGTLDGAGTARVAEGVPIADVFDESPAARSGIRPGDRIVRLDGRPVDGADMARFAGRLRAGDTVTLGLRRGDAEREVTVVAGTRPGMALPFRDADFRAALDSLRTTVSRRLDSVRDQVREARQAARQTTGDTLRIPRMMEVARIPARLRALQTELVAIRRAQAETERVRAELEERRERVRGNAARELERQLAVQERRSTEMEARGSALENALEELYRELGRSSGPSPDDPVDRADLPAAPPAPRVGAPPSSRPTRAPPAPAPYAVGRNYVLGARVSQLNPSLSEYFGVEEGVLVLEVIEDSPAGDADLRPGDVIVALEGVGYDSVEGLRNGLLRRGRRPGTLSVIRKGELLDLELR